MQIEVPAIPPERFVPEPDDACPECHGRGWKVVDDGGAGRAERCACQEREYGALLLARARIPERYRRCTLDNFNVANSDPKVEALLTQARTASQRYVESFLQTDGSFCDTGLIYVGKPGRGKTHLATAVLAELVKSRGVRGLFVDFTSLIHQIQATFDPSSTESKQAVIDPVIGADLLVFDELGAQKPTAWVMETLYYILNTRYTGRLPTIFTTNCALERPATPSARSRPRVPLGSDADVAPRIDESIESFKARKPAPRHDLLEERISEVLVSRIHQMAQPLELKGVDYRLEVKRARSAADRR